MMRQKTEVFSDDETEVFSDDETEDRSSGSVLKIIEIYSLLRFSQMQ